MEKKYKRNKNGEVEVGVLISAGFGAGWSTWGMPEEALFDPIIIDFVENDKLFTSEFDEYIENTYNDCYSGGSGGLYVCWIPEGKEFRIDEYDGAESLVLKNDQSWIIA
jgi:hypothetical protein